MMRNFIEKRIKFLIPLAFVCPTILGLVSIRAADSSGIEATYEIVAQDKLIASTTIFKISITSDTYQILTDFNPENGEFGTEIYSDYEQVYYFFKDSIQNTDDGSPIALASVEFSSFPSKTDDSTLIVWMATLLNKNLLSDIESIPLSSPF